MDEVERNLNSSDNAFSIVQHDTFDVLYSFASQFSALDDAARVRLVDVVCAGLANLVESTICLCQSEYVPFSRFNILQRGRK
jgi:hypothetical protein